MMLSAITTWKPFITDITTIRVATPSMIPTSEKPDTNEMKRLWRLDVKYRRAILRMKLYIISVGTLGVIAGADTLRYFFGLMVLENYDKIKMTKLS